MVISRKGAVPFSEGMGGFTIGAIPWENGAGELPKGLADGTVGAVHVQRGSMDEIKRPLRSACGAVLGMKRVFR